MFARGTSKIAKKLTSLVFSYSWLNISEAISIAAKLADRQPMMSIIFMIGTDWKFLRIQQ